MDTINITLSQVSSCADSLRTRNQQLYQNLQDITTVMQQLSGFWQSPASETISQRFMAMMPVFDNYRTMIDTYAKFLDQTVITYQSVENQINASADTFR